MKNLVLLFTLMFMSVGSYLQAQCPTSANITADSTCLFVSWEPIYDAFPKPLAIRSSGKQYKLNGAIGDLIRYSQEEEGVLFDCDTIGMSGFEGKIQSQFLGGPEECIFKGGEDLAECPDNVLVSQNENCLVFTFQEEFEGTLPDSVKLHDTIYYSQGYDSESPNAVLFLKDPMVMCDTTNMNHMPLGDTLYLGQKMCTYEAGILPITILAFDYKNDGDDIALSWEVNSEEPAQKLYLQKSYDGVDWVNVYEQNLDDYIAGQTMNGQYKDVSIEQPKLYYRLSISGFTGKAEYSSILPVTMKDQVINNLFYQSQSRSIMIKAGQNYVGKMHLINTHGQNMMTKEVRIQKNTYQEVNVQGHLTPGIYFVKFENSMIPPAKIFID